MKVLPDGQVISDYGMPLGRASYKDVQEYVANGVFKENSDGSFESVSKSTRVCDCGCNRPISFLRDFFGNGSAGATAECREKLRKSNVRAKEYLKENNLTIPSPNGGWMTPEESEYREEWLKRVGLKK